MSLTTLDETVRIFERLPKETRIEGLIALADSLPRLAPEPTDSWDVVDVRKDQECLDVVGLYARREGEAVRLAASVGQEVTTLTRALTALFVENLDGESAKNILSVTPEVIPRVVGEALMKQRSNTGYYTLRRIHEAVRALDGAGA
ncbi:MAG TPA: SufE family protein [Deinococcales bacterium]|nr:SufE family protein [Deinococcales bacterium]